METRSWEARRGLRSSPAEVWINRALPVTSANGAKPAAGGKEGSPTEPDIALKSLAGSERRWQFQLQLRLLNLHPSLDEESSRTAGQHRSTSDRSRDPSGQDRAILVA